MNLRRIRETFINVSHHKQIKRVGGEKRKKNT